ncbi:aliphatic sulfonate ABC transporter substrate-binding protein [Deinococcus sonorensis]|uniref:Aliphatic sulfonate ABC transporter substrate-binding protein n=2 Tax=Deinococcus sonorensis TaxID=309891 RepID=A0AAU7U8V1_9DEIO
MTNRTHLLTAAVLLSLGLTQAQQATTIRIGYFPNLTHAPALVALDRGDFQKAFGKVTLQTRDFVSGTQLSEAFAAGQIDIGYIGPGPAINAAARGLPVQIIAGASNAGAVLIARKDVSIASFKDLAGKRVAVPSLGNTQDISLRHILKEQGLKAQTDGGTVTIVPVAPADVAAAFSSRQIDAALVPEPWGAQLQQQGNKLVLDEKAIWRNGDYPTAVVIVNTKFAAANPELVKAFLKAHLSAVAFIKKNPPAAQQAISRQLEKLTGQKVAPLVLQRALSRTQISADLNQDALREYADLNKEAGYTREVPDLSKVVNLSVLKSLQTGGK